MPASNFENREYKVVHMTDEFDFGSNKSQSVMIFDIELQQVEGEMERLVKDLLGYSEVDPNAPSWMRRWLPARHPMLPFLSCVHAKIKGLGKGQRQAGFFGDYQFPNNGVGVPNYRVTATFQTLPWNVLSEEDITNGNGERQEWLRYVEMVDDPQLDFIQLERGEMYFAEGEGFDAQNPANAVDLTNPRTAVRQGWSIRNSTRQIRMVWRQVPYDGIYNPSTYELNNKITDGIGKVNSEDWFGFPAGTLLALEPKITRKIQPVSEGQIALGQFPGEPVRSLDIEYVFAFADPPYDPDATSFPPAGPVQPTRGWNIVPTPLATPRHWSLVTRDGTASGQRLYDNYDFKSFWEMGGW